MHFTLLANISIRITRHCTLTQMMIICVFLTSTARPALYYSNWIDSCSVFQTSDTVLFFHILILSWSFCLQKTISATSNTPYLIFFCHEGTQGEYIYIYASISSQSSSQSAILFLLFDTISVVFILHYFMFNSLYNSMPCTVLEYLIVSSTLSLTRGEVRKKENK